MSEAKSQELLLEIGCEEIPARFVPGALESLKKKAAASLSTLRLDHGAILTAGTPRRMTICVREVSSLQPDLVREVTGPARSVAYGADGELTRAGIGFARSQGVEPGELTIKSLPKGEYVSALRKETGRLAADILREEIPGWITSLRFPKSMRWGDGDLRFVRPLHWIVGLFGGEVLEFEVEGISSGKESAGHRFLSPGTFEVTGWDDYLEKTRGAMVIADPVERRASIARQIAEAAAEEGGEVSEDEELLDTVTHLVEFPVAVCGSFDEDFLKLPEEVLITSMRSHQKYFTLRDGKGSLMARFIAVSNMTCDDGMKLVREGNERVLRARLADARFFFEEDGKSSLGELVKELEKVVYQEKIGSYLEKTERVAGLAGELAAKIPLLDPADASRSALLGKADLVTQMVGEFPELQGVMGREYALLSGEKASVAKAIYEQYLPRFSGDLLPESDLGCVLSLADRADSIVGIFGIGEAPTGSEDPYGMRRHTLAIINILRAKEYPIELSLLFEKAICHLQGKIDRSAPELFAEIMEFFRGRLENLYVGAGHTPDVVKAVLSAGFRRMPEVRGKIEALEEFRKEEDFPPLAAAFKRAANIVPEGFSGRVDPARFSEEVERDLYEALTDLGGEVTGLVAGGDYGAALKAMAAVRPVVDRFFDGVLVMAEDREVRDNRLALVQMLAALVSAIADFRQLAV
jgi:glycyl-tRNA synthetase beta chain